MARQLEEAARHPTARSIASAMTALAEHQVSTNVAKVD
jgi:hypothetical protein